MGRQGQGRGGCVLRGRGGGPRMGLIPQGIAPTLPPLNSTAQPHLHRPRIVAILCHTCQPEVGGLDDVLPHSGGATGGPGGGRRGGHRHSSHGSGTGRAARRWYGGQGHTLQAQAAGLPVVPYQTHLACNRQCTSARGDGVVVVLRCVSQGGKHGVGMHTGRWPRRLCKHPSPPEPPPLPSLT